MKNSIKDVKRTRISKGKLVLKQTVATSLIKQWNQLLSSGLKIKLNLSWISGNPQPMFTCSKSTMLTPEQSVKSVQS